MKVLLLKSVPKLGLPGDTKSVADGYARNYLLPNSLAVLPSDPRAKTLREQRSQARTEAAANRQVAESKAHDWAGKTVIITAKSTKDGTLYAAVTNKEIAKQLGLDPKLVSFQPAKAIGSYEATIDVGEDAEAVVMVEVKEEMK